MMRSRSCVARHRQATARTGTRVPRIVGEPPTISGSRTMRGCTAEGSVCIATIVLSSGPGRKWLAGLEPRDRDSFRADNAGDDPAHDRTGRVAVAEAADRQPERLLIVVQVPGRAPER